MTVNKRCSGRKRHSLVDTRGLLLMVVVTGAGLQDPKQLLRRFYLVFFSSHRLKRIWADGGYAGALVAWVSQWCDWVPDIVKRNMQASGFEVLPKRWIVECTFAWLSRNRRLSRDYERKAETAEAFVYVAMIRLMTRRLVKL